MRARAEARGRRRAGDPVLQVPRVSQSPRVSATDRGGCPTEKAISPAGSNHENTSMRYIPARTAGSCSLSSRARSGSTLRIENPRSSRSGAPSTGPDAAINQPHTDRLDATYGHPEVQPPSLQSKQGRRSEAAAVRSCTGRIPYVHGRADKPFRGPVSHPPAGGPRSLLIYCHRCEATCRSVGRGGLEPPTSAVIGPQRCAYESGRPSVRRGVMWPDPEHRKVLATILRKLPKVLKTGVQHINAKRH